MKLLTIRSLGMFQVRRKGELIPPEAWPTQKCKTLLKILLIDRGRIVHKERLIELLWPDLAPDSAGSSLHVAVSQLRRLLEPELERPGQSHFVLTRSGGYLFQPGDDCWIDVDAFLEAVNRGQHWAQQEAWGPAVASFRTAEDLYHGDYLQEDAYEEWAIGPRERLREAYLECLSDLARCCARLGEFGEAVAACEKVLALDPVRESAYRQLMTYHYRQGDRDQALRAYERCRAALAETLGVAPMPQTRHVHERIVQDRPVPEPARPSSPATEPAQTQEKERARPDALPIAGRDDELQVLDDHLANALAGRGHTVFITGEAGIGKTRLAEALLERAKDRGVQVWRGKCHEIERDLPFRPLREALRPYLLRRLPPEQARRALGPWAPQVAVLVPEIKELLPGLEEPEPVSPEEARQRLLDGLTHFCLSLAGRYPLLLFLDDVQWADPSTLQFLHRFARNVGEAPILLLAAFRTEEVTGGHPLASVAQTLQREGLARRLALGSLSPAAVASLLERKAAPGWDSAAFSRRLFVETEGNALFLNELLQSLLEEGQLVEDDTGRWRPARGADLEDVALRLPETVQTVIESRCRGASDAAQDVLGAAAVIGRSFDVALLQRAGAVGTATLLDALDELLARRLVREPEEADSGEYAFGHDKIRKVVYEDLSRARRRHLHGQVAAALETLHDEAAQAPAGRLARHYAEAGQDDKALHYAILAGDQAAGQYAHTEALTHYQRALEIAERVEATPEQLVHLYTRRGRVLELDAQYGEARTNYEEMEAMARRLDDPPAELTAVMAQVTLYATLTSLFDVARAEELAERAMTLARDLDDRVAEAKLLRNLALLYCYSNRLPEAVDRGERSLALSRELGLQEQAAFALHDLGWAYGFWGRPEKSAAAFEEAGELWRELDNRPMLADSLSGLSHAFTFAGDFERALAAAEQAIAMGTALDNVWVKVSSNGNIGRVYWEMGRPDKTLAAAEEGFRITKEAGLGAVVIARAYRDFVYARLGADEQGLAILQRELKVAETQLTFALPAVRGMLARIHLQNDNLTEAEAVINQSREDGDDAWGLIGAVWLRVAEGELALRQGKVERGLAVTSDFLAELRDWGAGAYIPQVLTIRGRALLAAGQLEAAARTLEKARAKAEAMGSRQRLWQILAALAEVETARGNEEQAEGLGREAQEILREIAGRVPTADLRASFLARPDVRSLLDRG